LSQPSFMVSTVNTLSISMWGQWSIVKFNCERKGIADAVPCGRVSALSPGNLYWTCCFAWRISLRC
jgi:hypothetical protein